MNFIYIDSMQFQNKLYLVFYLNAGHYFYYYFTIDPRGNARLPSKATLGLLWTREPGTGTGFAQQVPGQARDSVAPAAGREDQVVFSIAR